VAALETDGVANTNIVWHAGKLLALEEGHAPFELDPVTLASKRPWSFNEKPVGPIAAHPKIDPGNGEIIFFGYSADGMLPEKMSYHVVNRGGILIDSQLFDAPYAAMVQGFMVTRDFVLFPIMLLAVTMGEP